MAWKGHLSSFSNSNRTFFWGVGCNQWSKVPNCNRYSHTQTHTQTDTHIHNTHIHSHTLSHTHTHTHTHTCPHTYTHTLWHMHTQPQRKHSSCNPFWHKRFLHSWQALFYIFLVHLFISCVISCNKVFPSQWTLSVYISLCASHFISMVGGIIVSGYRAKRIWVCR